MGAANSFGQDGGNVNGLNFGAEGFLVLVGDGIGDHQVFECVALGELLDGGSRQNGWRGRRR